MAKVLGIGGVFFKSTDPDKLTQWYAEHLGLKVEKYGGVRFDPEQMPKGGTTLWNPFKAETEHFQPSAKDFMFNFIVDDVDAALSQAAAGGAQLVGTPESYDYGRFGWFIDPDGNKIELWQPK
jgi:predicted enzyme related to lactoylglutathione lyase